MGVLVSLDSQIRGEALEAQQQVGFPSEPERGCDSASSDAPWAGAGSSSSHSNSTHAGFASFQHYSPNADFASLKSGSAPAG